MEMGDWTNPQFPFPILYYVKKLNENLKILFHFLDFT